MKNYYQILGVSPTAPADEIKRAYRRLASQHHPDKGGDTARFQEIEEAYRVLSDADQRSEYDNPGVRININSGQPFDFDNIFNMFGARFHQRQAAAARVMLWISLRDVAQGGKRVISVASSQGQSNVEIVIPPGVQDGDSVRYQSAAPGSQDLIITYRVRAEPGWSRDGDNVMTECLISVWDLILGGETSVQTLQDVTISIKVPAHTQPGTVLRVKSHGLPSKQQQARGDMLVKVMARLPDHIPQDLKDHIETIRRE